MLAAGSYLEYVEWQLVRTWSTRLVVIHTWSTLTGSWFIPRVLEPTEIHTRFIPGVIRIAANPYLEYMGWQRFIPGAYVWPHADSCL